ncbi:Clp protease N-terminal domain-containing protein [Dactylosporangium sp. NPDC051541]|uniref:Clp protease N-terminal domain-containing protein n=1 Tax=Dactylosporangium sp. NPDC051541 TaxID=3363977 RepID=UPI0037BDEE2B
MTGSRDGPALLGLPRRSRNCRQAALVGPRWSHCRDRRAAQVLEESAVAATGSRPAKDALAAVGIDVAEIQRRPDDTFGSGRFQVPRPYFSPRARNALELARREADALEHHDIDTGHLLLGLLDQSECVAVHVLGELRINPEPLRRPCCSAWSGRPHSWRRPKSAPAEGITRCGNRAAGLTRRRPPPDTGRPKCAGKRAVRVVRGR